MAHFLFNCNLHHYTDVTEEVSLKTQLSRNGDTKEKRKYPKKLNCQETGIQTKGGTPENKVFRPLKCN